jgi:hypothetical protein
MMKFKKTIFVAKSCPTHAKGKIYLTSPCLETKGLSWENCVGICIEVTPSVVASIRDFTSLVKKGKS